MQTAFRRALLLAPVVAALLTGIAFQRYERREVPRNSTPIVIFDQGYYTAEADGDRWALPGWDNYYNQHRSVFTAGCHTIAYAHAVQWVTGTARGDALLDELLGVCKNPSDQEENSHAIACKGLHANGVFSKEAYDTYLLKTYNIETVELEKSTQVLEAFFAEGGAIISLLPGHYVTAVEIRNIQGEYYVHVLDSNWGTTCRKGYTMYFLEGTDKLIRIFHTKEDTYNEGSDYWIPYSEYSGMMWKTPLRNAK